MNGGKVNRASMLRCILALSSVPAMAQVELSGSWLALNHEDGLERLGGPYAVDYTGIPLNEFGIPV